MCGAAVTVVSKFSSSGQPGLLSKRISLDADGRVVADGAHCAMATGVAITVPAPDPSALAAIIAGLGSHQAILLGSLQAQPIGQELPLVTVAVWRTLPEAEQAYTVTRSLRHVRYPRGAPAWMLIDSDLKAQSDTVRYRVAAFGGIWRALLCAAPGLAKAPHVARLSTSAGLASTATGERFPDTGGEHHFVLVEDSDDIARALRTLHERCWLHGLGWFMSSRRGILLARSLVDVSVAGPERLVFEGPPEIVPPLTQDALVRAPVVHGGAVT